MIVGPNAGGERSLVEAVSPGPGLYVPFVLCLRSVSSPQTSEMACQAVKLAHKETVDAVDAVAEVYLKSCSKSSKEKSV